MKISQKEFENTIKEFERIVDVRDQLWDRARKLLENGYEVDAYILILATWNFARFRYFIKIFYLDKFGRAIKKTNPIFKKLRNKDFESIDLNNKIIKKDIKDIYSEIKKVAEQTGASKIMALKNPKLFIMWDTEIRRIYKISNYSTPDDYIEFLIKMKDVFSKIKWNNKKRPFAKVIDEYNYAIVDKIRSERKKKKNKKINI